MTRLVHKYGGTSVATIERIQAVAERTLRYQRQGHEIVLVVSAMGSETNRLIGLAKQLDSDTISPEYDMLVASGEQVACALVALAINTKLKKKGVARAFLGNQVGIRTDNFFSKARIQSIDTRLLEKHLAKGGIPVIAGFQGVTSDKQITTLGRGGSDLSAVAIAVALKAQGCELYKDVDGILTADPKVCPDAHKLKAITYNEMLEMAALGSKVLQVRAVELAAKHHMPLHIRSSLHNQEGTRVVDRRKLYKTAMEEPVVSTVSVEPDQLKFTLTSVPRSSAGLASLFQALAKLSIVVDIIIQEIGPATGKSQTQNLSFTVPESEHRRALQALQALKKTSFSKMKLQEHSGLGKVSVIGVGMQHHPGVAAKMFAILAQAKIPIELISTSEIKISCLVPSSQLKKAANALHRGFSL